MQAEAAASLARSEAMGVGRVFLCSRSRFPLYNLLSLSWAILIRPVVPCIQAMDHFVTKESYIVLVLDDILLACFPMGIPIRVDCTTFISIDD